MFLRNSLSILARQMRHGSLVPSRLNQQLQASVSYKSCEGLEIESKDQVLSIRMNRPKKYNALSGDMVAGITEALYSANDDEQVKVVLLTGTGDYYSSGNDLYNFLVAMKDEAGVEAGLIKCRDRLEQFVDSIISLKKFSIAAVNGPAVGMMVTSLPLFDLVVASEKSTFNAPFTSLGQCPEACSSFTFPTIMGPSRSSELLLLNRTWDATKAQSSGLVSDVVPHDKFRDHIDDILYGKKGIIKTCFPKSLMTSRSLIRSSGLLTTLRETNKRECDAILKCWLSEECMSALQSFFKRSKS